MRSGVAESGMDHPEARLSGKGQEPLAQSPDAGSVMQKTTGETSCRA
jgi:hypothetical protein